jgi:hypothetical protein
MENEDFRVSGPDESGQELIVIKLSPADWEKFVEMLESPPAPNDELRALMSKPWADGKPFKVEE